MNHDDLVDRAKITDHVLRYATGIDRHDWTLYRSIFADQLTVDFSSWSGEPAASMNADAWVAGVRATLEPFDATQHVLTNFVIEVDGIEASCTCYMAAHHHLVTGDLRGNAQHRRLLCSSSATDGCGLADPSAAIERHVGNGRQSFV
jgi:hypothetical protein